MIFANIYLEYLFRLTLSLLCGFCFGLERKLRQHTVGLRTLILMSVSSCLLSIISVGMANQGTFTGDPTRIAAGVITGIGFLGAGAIFHQGLNIRGLTSAAIIFTVAAIGLAIGGGFYIPAVITLAFAMLIMFFMGKIEHKLFPAEKRKIVEMEFNERNIDDVEIRKELKEFGLIIHDMDVKMTAVSESSNGNTILIFTVKSPDKLRSLELVKKLMTFPGVTRVNISDK